MRHQEQQIHDSNPEYDADPETVRSEPVPVPPTSVNGRVDHDHPADDHTDDHDDAIGHDDVIDHDGPDSGARYSTGEVDAADASAQDDPDRMEQPEFHHPAPVPSALGAPTVGGAVAASALAGDEPGEPDPRAERTAEPGDGVVDDSTRDLPAGASTASDTHDTQTHDTHTHTHDIDGHDSAALDTDGRDTDDHLGTDPIDRHDAADDLAADGAPVDRQADVDSPATDGYPMVPGREDPDRPDGVSPTDDVAAADGTTGGERIDGTADDGALLPGAVPVDAVDALVPADAAQGFRDRWRDVQLRFVDDPRGAATDARELVGDVVESLTTALTAQRDALDDWQDGEEGDTERLRVAVRRYRDLVDRVLSL